MNKIYLVALVSVLSVGLAASVSYAAAAGTTGKSGFMAFNSNDLIGVPVKNPQGKFLGLVDGIMIGSDGQAFAIVNHGDADLYGPSGVDTPVPIAALRISETKSGKEMIVSNADTEHMDFAPYIDPTRSHSHQYEVSIDRYFGVQPSWTEENARSK